MFVVPKYTGGYDLFSVLSNLNHCVHIPTFKMPTIRQVWQLVQQGDYAFSKIIKDANLYIPTVKCYNHFLYFLTK